MANFSFQKEAMWFLNHYYLELFLLLPSSIFVVFLFKWWFGTYFSNNKKNPPPSPPKLPIIGNLHQIGPLAHRSFKSLAEKYGPVMLLHVGSRPLLVVSSAEAAHQVLIAKDVDFADKSNTMVSTRLYYESKAIAFAPYGEYWKQVRGISVHLILSQTRVQSLRNIREEEMELLIKNIREHIDSSSVIRMDKVLRAFTYEISSRAVIGRRFSDEGGKKFMELLKEVHDLLGVVNIGDYIPWLGWVNHFNGLEAKIRKVEKELDEHLENLIQGEMIRQRSTGSINVDQQRNNQSFLELLIESQKTNPTGDFLGVDAMKAITLEMVASTAEVYSVIEWALAAVIRHPNVMAKLQNEVKKAAGEKSFITEDNLNNLQYLKAVMKECLRFCPANTLVARAAAKNVKLMGYDIEEGTEVLVNSWAIGRDPSLWKDPEEFQPERFLNSSADLTGHHFHFIPFGSGRRGCPGIALVLAMSELTLANLVCNFNFTLPNGLRVEELDMTEAPGTVTRMNTPLQVVASAC